MDITDLVSAVAKHQWLPALMLLAVMLRTLFSDKSKFPASVSPNLRPVFVGIATMVIADVGALEAGKPVLAALLGGAVAFVAGGFLDGIAVAVFGSVGAAPSWAKWVLMIVDEVAPMVGRGGGSAGGSGTTQTPPASPPVPPAAARDSFAMSAGASRKSHGPRKSGVFPSFVLAVFVTFIVSGCALFGKVEPPIADCAQKVLVDAGKGMTVDQIVADVAPACGMDAAAVVAALLGSEDPAVKATRAYGEAVARANSKVTQ